MSPRSQRSKNTDFPGLPQGDPALWTSSLQLYHLLGRHRTLRIEMPRYGLKLSEQVHELHPSCLSSPPGLDTSQPRLPLCLYCSNRWPTVQPWGSAPAVPRDFLLVPLVSWGVIPLSPLMVRFFVTSNALPKCRGWGISHDRELITYADTLGHLYSRGLCSSTPRKVG